MSAAAQVFEGCSPEPAGGPLEVPGNGVPRWMAVTRRFGAGYRIRLTRQLVRLNLFCGDDSDRVGIVIVALWRIA